jgi:hypothetical protein
VKWAKDISIRILACFFTKNVKFDINANENILKLSYKNLARIKKALIKIINLKAQFKEKCATHSHLSPQRSSS